MPLVLAGATSGSTTIQATDATTQTITLPANSGTVLTSLSTQSQLPANIAGNGPTFSAYFNGTQTLTTAYTSYKITCETKVWDTNSNYDNTTNYRFTPTVAGYYQVNAGVSITSTNTIQAFVYKNGALYCKGNPATNASLGRIPSTVNTIIYMNGSTDYIELYGQSPSASQSVAPYSSDSAGTTYFNAALIRSA